jgi:ATP-citrate lyase alpha-subunit
MAYLQVEALGDGPLTKPLVVWVTGTCAPMLAGNHQLGHAGARAASAGEGAEAKNAALRPAGAVVPDSFDDYDQKIRETFEELRRRGGIEPVAEFEPPPIPMDCAGARRRGLVRRPTHFIPTICDERGEGHNHAGVPMDRVIEEGYGIGGVIGLQWFKKKLPRYECEFIELAIQIIADHFRLGLNRGLGPREFADYMKSQNVNIQGIGHGLHSVDNPDAGVEIMVAFARQHFPATPVLDYALAVADVTARKKGNLILNVDGCIGVLFVDLLLAIGYRDEEIHQLTDMGFFNTVFLLGRSIGFMGHHFDQKRLNQGLHQHPLDDILYDVPAEPESVDGEGGMPGRPTPSET